MKINKDLYSDFLSFEKKYNLFDKEFLGIKYWEMLRGYIYIELGMINNNLQPVVKRGKKKIIHQVSLNTIRNSLKILYPQKKDILFLNNPRRVKQNDGKYYCVYTDPLIDYIKDYYSYVTLEDPFWAMSNVNYLSHLEPAKTEELYYTDYIEKIYKLKKLRFLLCERKKYKEIENEFRIINKLLIKEFDVDIENLLIDDWLDRILHVVLQYDYYKNLLKKMDIKAVIEFYDIFPIKVVVNKAAKDLNIPVIEIQHGVVTKTDPIFLKYGDINKKYDIIPDYVFSYGEKLLNKMDMPIEKDNIFYTGNLFLKMKMEEYENSKMSNKNILFISQANIGRYISEFASKLADILPKDYKIIYKFHPYEIGNKYECLDKENIVVVDNLERDLYYYLSNCCAQVGVYSTGLYEGLNFNIKTFIIEELFGSSETMEVIKENVNIHYVKKPGDILENLGEYQEVEDGKYWQTVEKDNIIKFLKRIIDK